MMNDYHPFLCDDHAWCLSKLREWLSMPEGFVAVDAVGHEIDPCSLF